MIYLFNKSGHINGSITNWNTSNATNMREMSIFAIQFNRQLNWDTSRTTDIEDMFFRLRKFIEKVGILKRKKL